MDAVFFSFIILYIFSLQRMYIKIPRLLFSPSANDKANPLFPPNIELIPPEA